jgi:hypothetical protein
VQFSSNYARLHSEEGRKAELERRPTDPAVTSWREGSADWLYARVRVRVGHNKLIPEKLQSEWLLVEWPEGEKAPPNISSRPWLRTSASGGLSILPSCADASSVTTKNQRLVTP